MIKNKNSEQIKIRNWVEKNKNSVIKNLINLVDINTWTKNKHGINKAYGYLEKDLFKKIPDYSIKKYKQNNLGDLLYLIPKNALKKKPIILLSCHIDTVYEINRQKIKQTKDKLFGPGTCDMKGGLIVAIYSLLGLKELFNNQENIQLLISPDEEIGSTAYREIRKKIYQSVDYAFIFESCGDKDELVQERKSIYQLRLNTKGDGGHAGYYVNKNKSAITTMMSVLLKLDKLNNAISNSSINIGVIKGGTQANVIPEYAEAIVDVRCFGDNNMRNLLNEIKQISGSEKVNVETIIGIPAMSVDDKKLKKILSLLKNSFRKENLNLRFEKRGGGSDANQISQYGALCLDGFGPKGNFSHSSKEYVYVDSIFQKIRLMVNILSKFI